MKIIYKKSKISFSECETYLKTRIRTKDNIGINWISTSPKHIVLYYEDGSLTSRDTYQLLKTFFWGRIKFSNKGVRLFGVIVSGPITSMLSIETIISSAYRLYVSGNTNLLIPILASLSLLVWICYDKRKGRQIIEEHIFSNILGDN